MEIHTERRDGDDMGPEDTDRAWYRKRPSKRLLAPLLLVLAGVAIIGVASQRDGGWTDRAGYNDRVPRASVAYQGQVWVPVGNPVLLPDRRMVKVGETIEDLTLYTVSLPAGGGGGGPTVQPMVAANQVFLRVGQDQYQPIQLRRVGDPAAMPMGPRVTD